MLNLILSAMKKLKRNRLKQVLYLAHITYYYIFPTFFLIGFLPKNNSNWSQIFMKHFSVNNYDTKLRDWVMSRMKEVKIEYGKILGVIVHRRETWKKKRRNKSPAQLSLSKISPHMYNFYHFEKSEPKKFSH